MSVLIMHNPDTQPWFVLPCLLASACTYWPRNQTALTSDVAPFSGYVTVPSTEITVRARDVKTGAWDVLGTGTSSSQPYVDCRGHSWYYWSANVNLPQVDRYWFTGLRSGANSIKLKSDRVGFDIATFEPSADACISQYCSGLDRISYCASPQSPELTVTAPCGASGQMCCLPDDTCQAGLACSSNWRCVTDSFLPSSSYGFRLESPANAAHNWTDQLNGIASDGQSWFITQETVMWKASLNDNLDHDLSGLHYTFPIAISSLGYD